VTEAKTPKPETEAQARRKLAQAIGKVVALLLVALIVVLLERYCVPKPEPFGPDAKIVTLDGEDRKSVV